MESSSSRAVAVQQAIVTKWLTALQTPQAVEENRQQYYAQDPSTLVTSSTIRTLHFTNGPGIYHDHLLPALQAAEHEVILATCFWASSSSLLDLSSALLYLSQKALARGTSEKIRVRLCFSSRSLLQKLFHTRSPQGYVYPPNAWAAKLELPSSDRLGGLDLQVKSLFFRPVSVLHSKFVVIDRRVAFMPSCNVSWEEWCECFVAIEGPFVERLLDFWHDVWAKGDFADTLYASTTSVQRINEIAAFSRYSQDSGGLPPAGDESTIVLLPSRHHSSLSASLPFLPQAAPSTPLNTFLLTAFAQASHSIFLVTPNFTAIPVYRTVLEALAGGVSVHIITNRRMMVVEQLVTAATLTEIYVWSLVRAYRKLRRLGLQRRERDQSSLERGFEQGSSLARLGNLKVQYFRGLRSATAHKMHTKCGVIDEKIYVMGSGNMDRASWFTSQELGVALIGDFTSFIKDLKDDLILEDYFG